MNQREILNLSGQINPGEERTASAPYNFIPLPEVVVTAVNDANDLPDHDRYYPERHKGYFEITLTTKSPIYVRCPFTVEEFLRQERGEDKDMPFRHQVKNSPTFFYTRNPNQPVIPGSSLRGMLRSLLEIASYGKVQWVTDKKLFFRTVDYTAVGKYYRGRITGQVETGFLRRTTDGFLVKKCQMARVSRNKLGGNLYLGKGPNKTPRWDGQTRQWARVWVQLSENGRFVKDLSYEVQAERHEGVLVITGDIPGKKKEFVFLLPQDSAEEIPVPDEMLDRFHDDDQLTQWQEKAFLKDKPGKSSRERNGMLRYNPTNPGDPVFFLRENGQLTFFGRAQMFRLPYTQCSLDLVPEELRRSEDIDYAEALFGYVRSSDELKDMRQRGVIEKIPKQGDKQRAYASRVFVTDAILMTGTTDIWLAEEPIVPKILATPKPTAFQHYLVQDQDNKDQLKHYDSRSPKETVIRGHKRYWHQGISESEGLSLKQIRAMIEENKDRLRELVKQEEQGSPDTQHTQFKPIRSGVRFMFRVYFENLSDRELGALCWTLHPRGKPDKEYYHHLGMGKPLGMGAVKMETILHLTNPIKRYGFLFDGNQWQIGAETAGEQLSDCTVLNRRVKAFEQHVLSVLKLDKTCQHLSDLKRIGMLLKMMEWPGFRPEPKGECFLRNEARPNTRYMTIQPTNEYRDRPVLPDPSAFGELTGRVEPITRTATIGPPSLPPKKVVTPSHPLRPSVSEVKREWVTIVSEVKQGRATVRTDQGEQIMCGRIPVYPPVQPDRRCRADVTREEGRAVKAMFKGWY